MKRNNIGRCRSFRKNQTDAEKRLWGILRNRQLAGIKFRRQFSVARYILDFYSPEYKLGIEADGGQHYEKMGSLRDEARSKELSGIEIQILRFSDVDILKNTEAVCEKILEAVKNIDGVPPHLNPLP
jgi:adenine-specific DNA-methyltransferase